MIGRAFQPVKLASVLSLALLFASIAVLNVRLLGQNILGSIVGTVVDPSGGRIWALRLLLPTSIPANGMRGSPA